MNKLDTTQPLTDIQVAQGTHEGMTGKNNEDAYQFTAWQAGDRRFYLGVVADGVGGQTAGELASRMVVESITAYFDALPEMGLAGRNMLKHLLTAINESNTAVYSRSQEDKNVQGMAATVVVAAIFNGRLYTSHVGDSRIYFWRDEQLYQITQDHSWVQEAVEAGLITAEQARTHPNRNVIRRSLGTASETEVDQTPLSPDHFLLKQGTPLQKGDTLLLCSDGLSDMIEDEAIAATLRQHGADLDTAVSDLINQANNAGGRDNITVLLLRMLEGVSSMSDDQPFETETEAETSPTTIEATKSNRPQVVSVPLDKQEQERKALQRRILGTMLLILAGAMTLAAIIIFLIPYLRGV